MQIRAAHTEDSLAIAELALIAGDGIPAYFWEQSRKDGEELLDVGARNAASETDNFSYRNTWLAMIDDDIAGMLLAYKLPSADEAEDTTHFPEFIRPMIELEHCVPASFYVNMLASFPEYRDRGVGSALMKKAEELAKQNDCSLISLSVFDDKFSVVRFYERHHYKTIEQRKVIPHSSHPHHGQILLMVKETP